MSQAKDFNQQQYGDNFQQYLDSNSEGNIGGGTPNQRVELLKNYLPLVRTVFEIGSGGGIDAALLQKTGYKIIVSDYVDKFVSVLSQSGFNTVNFDAKKDNIPTNIDCIYANAVFVHFSSEELAKFLTRTKGKLNNEKLVFMSVIKGIGYERSARNRGFERDFYYYTKETLTKIFQNTGYSVIYLNDDDPKWIQVIITYK